MAKSKKTKPSFDRTPPAAKSDASAWVYRTEPKAPVVDAPAVDALVLDVAPEPPPAPTLAAPALILPPSFVRPRVAPTRSVSAFEHGIDLLSRPFGIAITLAVAVLGVFRGRRGAAMILVCGVLGSVSCNRYQTIWSGVEFQEDGRLKLAAEDPLCGCLTVVNVSGKDLALRSRFHGATVGNVTLKTADKLNFRFDWAGPEDEDFYVVEATDAQGTEVNLKDALRIEERSNWATCSTTACQYGDLLLNMGETGR